MGLFDSGSKAAKKAAEAQLEASTAAIAEQRRQFDESRADLRPFIDSGSGLLSGFTNNATLDGLEGNISALRSSGLYKELLGERTRSLEGQLSNSGLRRSGAGLSAIADLPIELLMGLESELNQRQGIITGNSQNAAAGLGALGADNARGIADTLVGAGDAVGQGILGGARADDASKEQAAQLVAMFLSSDRRLKTNIERVGHTGTLPVYTWEWIDEAPEHVKAYPGVGFMADEVAEVYPDAVREIGGFDHVNYGTVLEAENG